MKKFILSLIVIFSFGFYVIWQNAGNSANNLASAPVADTNNIPKGNAVSSTTGTKTKITPTSKPIVLPPKKSGIYNDGTYTGDSVDAYYGNIQVEVTVASGKISNIKFLDYPKDRGTSIRINSHAMPLLSQEAIAAQNANVNGVSGASETSAAFKQSLTSALNQAKA